MIKGYSNNPGTEAIVNAFVFAISRLFLMTTKTNNRNDSVEKIAKSKNVSMAQVALAWAMSKEGKRLLACTHNPALISSIQVLRLPLLVLHLWRTWVTSSVRHLIWMLPALMFMYLYDVQALYILSSQMRSWRSWKVPICPRLHSAILR